MGLRLLLLIAPLCLVVPARSQADPTAAVWKQIDANNAAVARAVHMRDFAAFETLWSPRMIVSAPENTIRTRDSIFAAIRNGGLNYSSFKNTMDAFSVFGDVAVEMGHDDFTMPDGPSAGKPLRRRYTDVWQRTGDHWVQIARQATILNVDADLVYGPRPVPPPSQPQ